MALITWTDRLSVGVPAIDSQHGVLVETLNELHDAMVRGQAKSLNESLLHSLLAYTRDHFSSEEAMMAAANYPGLVEHRVRHCDVTKKIERYVVRFEHDEVGQSLHLVNFLRDWLTNHIQNEDRDYCPCIHAHDIH